MVYPLSVKAIISRAKVVCAALCLSVVVSAQMTEDPGTGMSAGSDSIVQIPVSELRESALRHLYLDNDADGAISALLHGIYLREAERDTLRASLLREDLARLYMTRRYYREALYHYDLLVSYYTKHQRPAEVGFLRASEADIYVTIDSLRRAIPLYLDVEEQIKKEPNALLAEMHDASVTALTRQGYMIAGLTDTTEVDFGGLVDKASGFHALCLLNSGHRYYGMGLAEVARYYYEQCLEEEDVDEVIRRDALFKLARIYRDHGDFAKAYQYLEHYSFINDSLINDRRQRVIDRLLVTYETYEQKSKIRELQKDQKIAAFQNRLRNVLTFSLLFGSVIVLIGAYFTIRNYQHRFNANQIIHRQTMEINRQRITELENNVKIESMNSMIQGQEAERERVAKDLHDSLGGLLSTVKLHFDALQSQEEKVGETYEYQKAYALLDEACKEVRHISNNLQPGALHRLGLVPAITDLIHRLGTMDGTAIHLEHENVGKDLDVRISLNVYRIVQELINNALKHAEASEISVQLIQSEDVLRVTVHDNGKGYEPGSTARMGMGTENIASRVNYLKGDISIHSVIGEGTTTQVDIPLQI